jgi:hypothetical protein
MRAVVVRKPSVSFAVALAALSACATAGGPGGGPAAVEPYGPLTVNQKSGGDFYVTQDGAFAPATVKDGAILIQLRNRPFQIGTSSHQLNICLTLEPAPEVRSDPQGHEASCLSGPMQGALEPNSAELLVYGGKKWSDGNTVLQDGTGRRTQPLAGYARAYQIDELLFTTQPKMNLASFRGTLYGWIVVYKEHVRRNRDIMPIRLVVGD